MSLSSNSISITDNNINFWKNPSEKNLLKLKEQLTAIPTENNRILYLALHPIFKIEKDKDGNLNMVCDRYEILARKEDGNDFPFDWYAKLPKKERLDFTQKCFELSKFLKQNGIIAKFNLQIVDLEYFEENLHEAYYELAEFGESDCENKSIMNQDGKIVKAGNLFPNIDRLESDFYEMSSVFDFLNEATIDDCFTLKKDYNKIGCPGKQIEEARNYDIIKKLIGYIGKKYGSKYKPISAIKIDYSLGKLIYNKDIPNTNVNKMIHKVLLDKTVEYILKVNPEMIFIIEYSMDLKSLNNEYLLDRYLLEGNNQVLIQGGALDNYAFRINSYGDKKPITFI